MMRLKINLSEKTDKIVLDAGEFSGKTIVVTIEEDNPKQIIYERNFYRGRVLGDLSSLLYELTGEKQSNDTLNEYLKSLCNPVVEFGGAPHQRIVSSGSTKSFTAHEWASFNERCKRLLNSKLGLFGSEYLHQP